VIPTSTCIRGTVFDGFPGLLNGNADAQGICIDPRLAKHDNVALMTNSYVSKLWTDASGRRVDAVHVERDGEREIYSTDIVMVACGSLSSARLQRSGNDRHPNGRGNGSDQVGCNYMRHVNGAVFEKTFAFSDFYFGSDDWDYPLGLIQMFAISHADLKRKLKDVLSEIDWPAVLLELSLYLGENIPLCGTAHQAGTCRFGTDPVTSVLNLDCRVHASFFPPIGAINPTLTIIANALRVADIIKDRL